MSQISVVPAPDLNPEAALLRTAAQIDRFEGYAHPHAARIAALANQVAVKFHLAAHDLLALRQAALMHDIGEMVMDRGYIKRGTLLNSDERLDLMRHSVVGESETAKRGLNRAVQLLVRWHHEWWNGAGYPDGLRRERIPLAARILRCADTYAALTDHRPVSPAIPAVEAKRYLTEWAGLEFDPQVVLMFLSLPDSDELRSHGDDEFDHNRLSERLPV